jgi:hypothetical protein
MEGLLESRLLLTLTLSHFKQRKSVVSPTGPVGSPFFGEGSSKLLVSLTCPDIRALAKSSREIRARKSESAVVSECAECRTLFRWDREPMQLQESVASRSEVRCSPVFCVGKCRCDAKYSQLSIEEFKPRSERSGYDIRARRRACHESNLEHRNVHGQYPLAHNRKPHGWLPHGSERLR